MRGRLTRNWLHRFFRRNLRLHRLNRSRRATVRINWLDVPIRGGLLWDRWLVATILLLACRVLLAEGTTLLVGAGAALAHATATDRGASTHTVSSCP